MYNSFRFNNDKWQILQIVTMNSRLLFISISLIFVLHWHFMKKLPVFSNDVQTSSELNSTISGRGSIVRLFFPENSPDGSCFTLTAVSRRTENQTVSTEQVLKMLFTGPTEAEIKQGVNSLFDQNTQDLLQDMYVKGDKVFFNLRKQQFDVLIDKGILTSCGSIQFLMSIRETLAYIMDTPTPLDTFSFCFLVDNNPIKNTRLEIPRTCE